MKEQDLYKIVPKEAIALGSMDSSVGICCLWSQRSALEKILSKEKFFILGNLYSIDGISKLVRTAFAFPKMRFLIVCGADLSGTGEALKLLFEKGVSKEHKIQGTSYRIEETIPLEDIEKFRKEVKFIDLRQKPLEEVKQKLEETAKFAATPFTEAKTFPEAKPLKPERMFSENSGFTIHANTVSDAWLKALDLCLKFGFEKNSEYNVMTKEVIDLVTVIHGTDSKHAEFLPFTEKQMQEYLPSILTPEKPASVSYTYGERLFKREDFLDKSQVEYAIQKLKDSPNTRRAISFAWRDKDQNMKADQPCLLQIIWNIQEGMLFQTVFFRSHDLFSGYPMNLLALQKLHQNTAKEIGSMLGPLTCVSVSAHIYEDKWKTAKEVLEKYYSKPEPFTKDPRGNWVITVEDKKIKVQHYDFSSQKTPYYFEGFSYKELSQKLLKTGLFSRIDHAFDIGSELRQAELALKLGKPYSQDKGIIL